MGLVEKVTTHTTSADLLAAVRARPWFYEFDLPDGTQTESYLPPAMRSIHTTRLEMLWAALEPLVQGRWADLSAIDIACHQGFYATQLARKGLKDVLAVDVRPEHLADAAEMAKVYQLRNMRFQPFDVENDRAEALGGPYDITLLYGLLYHVENPIRLLRIARAVTRQVCVIETQLVPNQNGSVDWGSHTSQRPMVASFGLIDEIDEKHAPEASHAGLCVVPSLEALHYILRRVGFRSVELVPVPEGGYEQLTSGKRVVVAAYV